MYKLMQDLVFKYIEKAKYVHVSMKAKTLVDNVEKATELLPITAWYILLC